MNLTERKWQLNSSAGVLSAFEIHPTIRMKCHNAIIRFIIKSEFRLVRCLLYTFDAFKRCAEWRKWKKKMK